MKKTILILSALIAISFQQPKVYTLKLTDNQLQQLYYCLDKSEAEHTIVTGLQSEIQKQFQAQLQADTTNKKK